tara:strand:+ start:1969 stop:2142 length:174 start_codon:yes stop_codon:yes gene_type:complete
MKIKRWFFIKANSDRICKNNLYIYNPYLKGVKDCLKTINTINNTNYKLNEIEYYFTD